MRISIPVEVRGWYGVMYVWVVCLSIYVHSNAIRAHCIGHMCETYPVLPIIYGIVTAGPFVSKIITIDTTHISQLREITWGVQSHLIFDWIITRDRTNRHRPGYKCDYEHSTNMTLLLTITTPLPTCLIYRHITQLMLSFVTIVMAKAATAKHAHHTP